MLPPTSTYHHERTANGLPVTTTPESFSARLDQPEGAVAPHHAAFRAKFSLGEDLKGTLGADNCPCVRSAADVAAVFAELTAIGREVMAAGALDCQCRLLTWSLLGVGSSDRLFMRIGDAFHGAIASQGSAIVLAHNHPSGSLTPSRADLTLTRNVAEAGLLLGYPLLDHVVISRKGYRSLMAAAVLKRYRQHACITNAASKEAAEGGMLDLQWQCGHCGARNQEHHLNGLQAQAHDLCKGARCTRCRSFTWLTLGSIRSTTCVADASN